MTQLKEYFDGNRTKFDLNILLDGTQFQKQVWEQLQTIPHATTVSYKDIAKSISNEKAVRAVGSANGKNPIAIAVPCHRVIGSDGSLSGYAYGVWRKQWLINHEKKKKEK